MSKLVTIAESDLYFNRLKDRPELIKHYIESKSIIEFINKTHEAQEIVTLYMNILRSVYELLTKMRELIISNNTGAGCNKDVLMMSLITYSEEIDNSIKSMIYKNKEILNGYVLKSVSIDNEKKINVTRVGDDDKLNISSFYWEGVCSKIDGELIYIDWTKKKLVNENKYNVDYKTGTAVLKNEDGCNKIEIDNEFTIEVDVNRVELLDRIVIDSILEYHFIVGENQTTTTLFFPRFGTNIYNINRYDIENDYEYEFSNIEQRVKYALDQVNQCIGMAGSEINVISMKTDNLKNRYSSLMSILNNYCENI